MIPLPVVAYDHSLAALCSLQVFPYGSSLPTIIPLRPFVAYNHSLTVLRSLCRAYRAVCLEYYVGLLQDVTLLKAEERGSGDCDTSQSRWGNIESRCRHMLAALGWCVGVNNLE